MIEEYLRVIEWIVEGIGVIKAGIVSSTFHIFPFIRSHYSRSCNIHTILNSRESLTFFLFPLVFYDATERAYESIQQAQIRVVLR